MPGRVSALQEQDAYRPDIDGLRAVAVLSVVVFHAGVMGLPGGFIGVDIFFVISGYLIGGQIFRQARHGAFSYADFYARRVRRILPALYALLAVLLLAGSILMTPLELREMGKEAVATILGASNILFYTGGGYFGPASNLLPLLMTWSLGVEEQFYIFFPIIVFLILRLKWRPLFTLWALSLMSFVGSLLLTKFDQQAAFYLLPTRSWELGLGAILALWEQQNPSSRLTGRAAELLAGSAALMLAAALTLYRPAFAFPGLYALWPVLGAAILIATRTSFVNRWLLSHPAASFIGKVSYSFYLWHWPLIYFNRVLFGEGRGLPPLALIAGSFVLAVLSWRFVEQPFRRRKLGTAQVLWAYAALALVLSAPLLAVYISGGWQSRLPPAAKSFADQVRVSRESPCLAPYGAVTPQHEALCLAPTAQHRVIVLGDSHASALAPGLKHLAEENGFGFGEITKSSCPPLAGFALVLADRPRHFAECVAFQKAALDYVVRHPDVKTVVLAGFWSNYLTLTEPGGGQTSLSDALRRTIAALREGGRRVVLVQDVPVFTIDPYARVVGGMMPARRALTELGGGALEGFAAAPLADTSHAVLRAVSQDTNTLLLDPAPLFAYAGQMAPSLPAFLSWMLVVLAMGLGAGLLTAMVYVT